MSGNKKNEEATPEDCKRYAQYCAKKPPPPAQTVSHPLRYYELTPEEMRALEECDKESFYQRCLPFSTLFATLTYAAINNGYLSRNPHFGAVPKLMVAVILGHICGRLSYITQCDIKLRQLPKESYLGYVMREHYFDNNPHIQRCQK